KHTARKDIARNEPLVGSPDVTFADEPASARTPRDDDTFADEPSSSGTPPDDQTFTDEPSSAGIPSDEHTLADESSSASIPPDEHTFADDGRPPPPQNDLTVSAEPSAEDRTGAWL